MNAIPKYVKVKCLNGNENSTLEKVWNQSMKGNFIGAFKVVFYTILAKKTKSVFEQEIYLSKILPEIDIVF